VKKIVNLYEAKTNLSKLARAAAQGEEMIIARNGNPLAPLGPIRKARRSDFFGMDRCLVVIPDDFDETPSDFKAYR
jgi:antitoxin (DNA-binding transcriptional repressor) of toxin-antitoxin stability system